MKLKLTLIMTLLFGIITKTQNLDQNLALNDFNPTENISFNESENPPLAPGCALNQELEDRRKCTTQFIQKHLAQNFDMALASDVVESGKIKINIEFEISKFGKPINITANGGPEILNQNVVKVMSLLPDMTPGTKDGKPINITCKLPLEFQIAE